MKGEGATQRTIPGSDENVDRKGEGVETSKVRIAKFLTKGELGRGEKHGGAWSQVRSAEWTKRQGAGREQLSGTIFEKTLTKRGAFRT